MTTHALSSTHRALLNACAEHLRLTPEETLRRAVTRLHVALFSGEASIEDVDFSQSAESLEGPGVQVACLFEMARAFVEKDRAP
jgi:hypothetical protein